MNMVNILSKVVLECAIPLRAIHIRFITPDCEVCELKFTYNRDGVVQTGRAIVDSSLPDFTIIGYFIVDKTVKYPYEKTIKIVNYHG